jgi:hypothetical protein
MWLETCPKDCVLCDSKAVPVADSKLSKVDVEEKEESKKLSVCAAWKLVAQSFTGLRIKDNEGWAVKDALNANYICSGISVFGGFGNFGKKA